MSLSSRLLIVFLRFPEPGQVKTRLSAQIGPLASVAVYKRLVHTTFHAISADPARRWIYGEPAERLAELRSWLKQSLPTAGLAEAEFLPQSRGDLGRRLDQAFFEAFGRGFESVIAIGTDCPDLTAGHLAEAWRLLDEADAVFGPALDGGYYLIGLRKLARQLFENIPWSDARTLASSLDAAEASGLSFRLLETLRDIDTVEDLRAVPWLIDFEP